MLALRKAASALGTVLLPVQPVASHSSKQPEPELTNLSSSPVKAATDPIDRMVAEASGIIIDHDRDSVVEVSRDDADQSSDESDSGSDSLESATDSGPKSATGNCLTCSDTKEVAINTAHKTSRRNKALDFSITK